jgi:AGZA family xanthine/uracil permease-like MFS transporter
MPALTHRLNQFFQLDAYGTNVRTEVLAGLSTYLSLCYIFVVSPAILSAAGIDPKAALFATAVASSLATIAMGLWANLPFAVAPGLTMSSYFSFVVVQKLHLSWPQALATVFLSGILCVILTSLPVRQTIIRSIPAGLKQAIAVTIGIFVATIGLFLAKLITPSEGGIIDFAFLKPDVLLSPLTAVLLCGLVLSIVLGMKRLRFPAGMLVAIILAALLHHHLFPNAPAPNTSGDALASVAKLDFSVLLHSEFWLPVIVFFVLDFFEGIGGFIGMTSNTSIQDRDGNVPNMKKGLWVDGFGTIGGALVGTSSLIIFVESAVGINAGGRTGLTAIVCGSLMAIGVAASFEFAEVLTWVPAQAVAGVLVYVGYLIFSGAVKPEEAGRIARFDLLVMIGMAAIAFLTFSLDKSLAFGFLAYFLHSLKPGTGRQPALWLGGIAIAMSLAIAFSA